MAKRKIIWIDEQKCTGCGLCIPNCAEGALKIIDEKAKLISEKFCDGLGACLGYCPEEAITIIEREAEEFDQKAVEFHLSENKKAENQPIETNCPSSRSVQFHASSSTSQLYNWPVQLKLVPIDAPYFENANLLITADCVPFAYSDFHQDFLKERVVVVGCPKLDDIGLYRDKLTAIFTSNSIISLTISYMEVPCCFSLVRMVEEALSASGKNIRLRKVKISIRGEIQTDEEIPHLSTMNRKKGDLKFISEEV
ncbi:MAG: ATP-binding protein [Thermodesulfobacteriota bacterium]